MAQTEELKSSLIPDKRSRDSRSVREPLQPYNVHPDACMQWQFERSSSRYVGVRMQEAPLRQDLSRPCRHPAVVALQSSTVTIVLCLALAVWHTSYTAQSSPHILIKKLLVDKGGCVNGQNHGQANNTALHSSDGRCNDCYIRLLSPFRPTILCNLSRHPHRDSGDDQLQAQSTWPGSRCAPHDAALMSCKVCHVRCAHSQHK